ncbi:MAG: hypothetical protein LBS98_05150, partial [Coriobacteriales bacterium]|nr:hypothetical protein [Coriobacteriales bacterium]
LLTFNLSQMNNPEDLVAALHKVRDSGLKGRLPFAFFDEFDSRLGTEDLGWLKYFLTPMQDGTFTDKQGHIHQTGRALFIFAGGTSSSMGEFKKGILLENGERDAAASISCKHPDFVSRIKGYINVMGPDGTRPGGMLHYFRRATLLRKMLERKFSVSGKDRIEIEDNVLTAFLKAEKYYNGSRSLQAIVELSDLPKHGPLRGSNIYLDDTLGLYVSPDFVDYLKGHLS